MVIFVVSLACRPFEYNWDKSIPGGQCINQPLCYIFGSSFNVFTDIAILFLPLRGIWRLQLRNVQKFQLSGVFLLGSLYVLF